MLVLGVLWSPGSCAEKDDHSALTKSVVTSKLSSAYQELTLLAEQLQNLLDNSTPSSSSSLEEVRVNTLEDEEKRKSPHLELNPSSYIAPSYTVPGTVDYTAPPLDASYTVPGTIDYTYTVPAPVDHSFEVTALPLPQSGYPDPGYLQQLHTGTGRGSYCVII